MRDHFESVDLVADVNCLVADHRHKLVPLLDDHLHAVMTKFFQLRPHLLQLRFPRRVVGRAVSGGFRIGLSQFTLQSGRYWLRK